MNNGYWILIGLIVFVLWLVYWRYIHPTIQFKDKTYQKKNLLELEYKRLNQHVYHLEIIGFSFIITGLSVIEHDVWKVLVIIGIAILFMSISVDGRSERRYQRLREIIKKEKIKTPLSELSLRQ